MVPISPAARHLSLLHTSIMNTKLEILRVMAGLLSNVEVTLGGEKVGATCMAAEGSMTSQRPSLANRATLR